ncbi:MAG: hypothetical protein JXQ75_22595 [Phycisphaerae bacterium]|nr:hypothetical protein [Phycisphaerae bacterium]
MRSDRELSRSRGLEHLDGSDPVERREDQVTALQSRSSIYFARGIE